MTTTAAAGNPVLDLLADALRTAHVTSPETFLEAASQALSLQR